MVLDVLTDQADPYMGFAGGYITSLHSTARLVLHCVLNDNTSMGDVVAL